MIKNPGLVFPRKHITVNLARASGPKAEPVCDLPIALGGLLASGQVPPDCLEGTLVPARTIADRVKPNAIAPHQLVEARQYRSRSELLQ